MPAKLRDSFGRPARFAVVYSVCYEAGPQIRAFKDVRDFTAHLASMASLHYATEVQALRVTPHGMVPV